MAKWRLSKIKLLRLAKQWWRITLSSTLAPLTDASALLEFLITAALVFLGFVRWREQVESLIEVMLALVLAVPVFFVIKGVLAVFKVRAEERKLGVWQGNKFIYHSKLHVYTVEVSAKDNGAKLVFKLKDPEIDSLVETIVEVDRHDEKVRALVVWTSDNTKGDLSGITRQTRSSLRLPKDRTLRLCTYAEPEANPTTIRVYISSWTICQDGYFLK